MEIYYIPVSTPAERKKAEEALRQAGITPRKFSSAQVEDLGLVNAIKEGLKSGPVAESAVRAILSKR